MGVKGAILGDIAGSQSVGSFTKKILLGIFIPPLLNYISVVLNIEKV